MRVSGGRLASVVAVAANLAAARTAGAATWYVSPTGTATGGCTDRSNPCDLASAASGAVAGDTVVLMDGVYATQLNVANSGTSSAWITFQADDCSTPIVQGPGVSPTDNNQDVGVGSTTGSYLRFVGIVSRGWSSGFSNGWTGTDTTTSNGHFEYDSCVADQNGRTGITFFSAQGIKVKNCIVGHNGSSTAQSWSSGVTLYEAQGGAGASWVEANVSFENLDNQKHTDGSGFIIDEYSDGATFIDNVAFRNGGSCMRLTKSQGCKFINNTCYHNAQDAQDDLPANPGEVYFTADTSNTTTTGVTFMNDVLVATGTGPGAAAVYNQPTAGWSNNQVSTGSVSFFTAPDGTNPDFTLSSGSSLAGKGATGGSVPTNDIGLDPKCIVKRAPAAIGMMMTENWWQYSVDLNYIKSIGGVARCFHSKNRSGTPDIGAYASGAVTTSPAGNCSPPTSGGGGSSGADGGAGGQGGSSTSSSGGGGGGSGGAGSSGAIGASSSGGSGAGSGGGVGGSSGATTSGSGSTGGSQGSGAGGSSGGGSGAIDPVNNGAPDGGGSANAGGGAGSGDVDGRPPPPSACACRVTGGRSSPAWFVGLAAFGASLVARRRRRAAPRRHL